MNISTHHMSKQLITEALYTVGKQASETNSSYCEAMQLADVKADYRVESVAVLDCLCYYVQIVDLAADTLLGIEEEDRASYLKNLLEIQPTIVDTGDLAYHIDNQFKLSQA